MTTAQLSAVEHLWIEIDGAPAAQAFLGLHRIDVRDAYGINALASGFAATIPMNASLGRHALTIAPTAPGAATLIRLAEAVNVTPPYEPFNGAQRRQENWKFAIDGVFFRDDTPVMIGADGVYVIPADRPADLRLWVIDTTSLRAPRSVVARSGGRYLEVTSGIARDDAAASLNAPNAVRCGFSIPLLPGSVGIEDVAIYGISHSGAYAHLVTIHVRQPQALSSSVLPETAHIIGGVDEIFCGGTHVESRGDLAASPAQSIRLRGWAIDAAGPRLTGGTEVLIDEALIAAASSTNPRPDIAAEFGAGVTDSEFDIVFNVPNVPAGNHVLTVRVYSARRDARAELLRTTLHV